MLQQKEREKTFGKKKEKIKNLEQTRNLKMSYTTRK